MKLELQKLQNVWLETKNKATENTELPQITFDDLTNSIMGTGPFFYYIIDFYDMSLSHVSSSITDIHGFDPATVTFNDILGVMHPDDLTFSANAETFIANFFYNNIGEEKLLKYKVNYSFRVKLKNDKFILLNHQAIMLTLDSGGGFGKSLNIHTRIDHLSNNNTYKISLIGLNGEPSFMNLSIDNNGQNIAEFSKREIEIIKLIADGNSNEEIANKLFISDLTVKKHRNNILNKSDCKNTAQLIKTCILQGLISWLIDFSISF